MLRRKGIKDGIGATLRAMTSLGRLSDREIKALVTAGKEVDHPAGTVVLKQGETGVGFHLILEGAADVLDGDRVVATLGPGDFFGEMGLMAKVPRSASVVATSDLRTFVILSWSFRPLLETNPALRDALAEAAERRSSGAD